MLTGIPPMIATLLRRIHKLINFESLPVGNRRNSRPLEKIVARMNQAIDTVIYAVLLLNII